MTAPTARHAWDAAGAVEAAAAGEAVLWRWEPGRDRLSLTGASGALGLSAVGPRCSGAAFAALVMPGDRAELGRLLTFGPPGVAVRAALSMRGGERLCWTGSWMEDGEPRACGVVVRELGVAASDRDGLTGLLDRRSFVARARERLERTPGRFVLVVADLDRLRRLNEALGHDRADMVLAALGSRLSAAFPAEALPARIGEDEFAVLAAVGGDDPAERLRAALEAPVRLAGFDILPTLALGAVESEGGEAAADAAELLRRAELAVEAAKTGGRGGEAAYRRALETDQLSRLALEADLRLSLGRREIEPFFQPIVRLADGRIAGFEALMRWRHPRRGLLPPDDFIALAEEMGLMPELGRWMIEAAARQLAAWSRAHPRCGELSVSVNLSTEELDRDGLVDHVRGVIKAHALKPGALKLEITESQIMKDPERAAATLHRLREAGAGLALDDFGTGFSSLSYLGRLPFDSLKIDRYFVRTMGSHGGSDTIVRSVAQLGRDLQLEVVAEGVESRVMAERLLGVGCHYGQGYGYAPALPAQEAEVYLAESYLDDAAPVYARS